MKTGRGNSPTLLGVRTETTLRGVRYILPSRAVAHQRKFGLGLAAVGMVPPLFAALVTSMFWWAPVSAWVRGQGAPGGHGWFGLIGLVFPLLALQVTFKAARLGLLIAFGTVDLELDDRHAVGRIRWGLLRRRTRVSRGSITRVIDEPGLGARKGRQMPGPLGELHNLAVMRTGKDGSEGRVGLVHAYPKELTAWLAHDLADRLGVETETSEPPPMLIDRDRSDIPATPRTPIKRPRGATGLLTVRGDGLGIELPPRGYFKGSKGLGSFSVCWMGFVSVFAGFMAVSWIKDGFGGGDDWLFAAMIGFLVLVGGLMVLGACRAGRRRGFLDVVGRDLLITRQSLGSPKAHSWHADEIESIEVGHSGVEINNKPVLELQVIPKEGKTRGFFSEREDRELRWIAGELNGALWPAGTPDQA